MTHFQVSCHSLKTQRGTSSYFLSSTQPVLQCRRRCLNHYISLWKSATVYERCECKLQDMTGNILHVRANNEIILLTCLWASLLRWMTCSRHHQHTLEFIWTRPTHTSSHTHQMWINPPLETVQLLYLLYLDLNIFSRSKLNWRQKEKHLMNHSKSWLNELTLACLISIIFIFISVWNYSLLIKTCTETTP